MCKARQVLQECVKLKVLHTVCVRRVAGCSLHIRMRHDYIAPQDYQAIREHLTNSRYQLLIDLSYWTGQQWCILLNIRIKDVYSDGEALPKLIIKTRAHYQRNRVAIPIHPQLREILADTILPNYCETWLFESKVNPGQPICFEAGVVALRNAVAKARLRGRGISPNSFRYSFVRRLLEQGMEPDKIRRLSCHSHVDGVIHLAKA